MSKKKIIITSSVLAIAGIGLYAFNQYRLADKLCYGTSGFKFKKFGLNSTTIGLNLTIKNKDKLKAEIVKTRLKVLANNIPVTEISQTNTTTIAPKSESTMPLNINFSPKELVGNLSAITSGTGGLDNIVLKFKGWITVKKFGIPFPIPLSFKYTIKELRQSDTSEC